MANRRVSSGLTIGQLLTLTFGFLVASIFIFGFGFWVGRDMTEQRLGRQQEVVHLPVPNTPVVTKVVAAAGTETPVRIALAPTSTPGTAKPTVSATVAVAKATPTRLGPMVAWAVTPTQRAAQKEAGGWTVQVGASTDAVQAVVLARRLRAKGYDAYTSQGPIGGVTWYRVRVGRFSDKDSAKAMEGRLRREEQIEAAYVSPQ
jgi:cell division septation protein DedD